MSDEAGPRGGGSRNDRRRYRYRRARPRAPRRAPGAIERARAERERGARPGGARGGRGTRTCGGGAVVAESAGSVIKLYTMNKRKPMHHTTEDLYSD